MTDALAGFLVLDCGESVASAWCTRMLADFGARTMLVEPRGGTPIRHLEPFDATGTSIVAHNVLANKESIAVDEPPSSGDVLRLNALLEQADVVVVNDPKRLVELFAMDLENMRRAYPALLIAVVSQAGATTTQTVHGPVAAHDLIAYALSGWGSLNGLRDRPPLKGARYTASMIAGACAYAAIVTGLLWRQWDARGRMIDVAENEAMLFMFGRAIVRAQYEDDDPQRPEAMVLTGGFPVQASDGYVSVGIGIGRGSRDALGFLGLPELANVNWSAEHADRVQAAIRRKSRNELIEGLGPLRVGVGPVLAADELLRDRHLESRAFFTVPEDEPSAVRHCGPPFRMSRTPARLRNGIPAVGEHEVDARGDRANSYGSTARALPLAGTRVLTFTHAWSGTFCTELLGLAGADVLQIEAPSRPDGWRMSRRPIPEALARLPSAQHPWNCSGFYNSANLNKRAITLDVKDPRGRDLFMRLFEKADVVVENFSPHVMRSWELDYDNLSAIKPDLVMCSLSAFGATGPYGDFIGFGGTVEPASGMSALLGYGDRPLNSGNMIPDPVAGYYAFAAIVTALLHRTRTGEGQNIDLSMQEACMTVIGDALIELQLLGRTPEQMGNSDPSFAPHGYYPASGDDQWVALCAPDDVSWEALCKLMGEPTLVADARFDSNAARRGNRAALDTIVSSWSARLTRADLVDGLRAAGIPSAPVLSALEAAHHRDYATRGAMARVRHPEAGEAMQPVSPFRIDGQPCVVTRPAPMFGEHSREVLVGELGLSTMEYDELVEAQVTGNVPRI